MQPYFHSTYLLGLLKLISQMYFQEPDGIKSYKSDYLTLNGKNLNRASKESDMKVRIGSKFCNVTSLSLNQLTCKPPEEQPSALTP